MCDVSNFHSLIGFRPQSTYNAPSSLIAGCPCGCGKEHHSGGEEKLASTGKLRVSYHHLIILQPLSMLLQI